MQWNFVILLLMIFFSFLGERIDLTRETTTILVWVNVYEKCVKPSSHTYATMHVESCDSIHDIL